jgi:signal transduction histidine kinase
MSDSARRILVADDEAQVRQAFLDALAPAKLKEQGLAALEEELFGDAAAKPAPVTYDITTVSQGADAIEAVRTSMQADRPFGVVFLDMRMPPGIDGAQTAKAIRDLDPSINIVLVTGYSDIDVAEIAIKVLPADKLFFIAKPFHVAEIRQQAAALSARWSYETTMVRELMAQNAELASARTEAIRANLAKSHFLANVSHELRTPLNAIIGFSDIMAGELYGPHGDARYLDYSREINTSGVGLLGAINDIIDTARLDIGKVVLSVEQVDANEILARVTEDLKSYALRKSVSLAGPPSGVPAPMKGDVRRLQQIMFGIVHNAIKFTPGGKHVTTSAETVDGNVVVIVRDEGEGMAADLINTVQRPFAQGDNEFARHNSGLGLGLSLAKRLVELHQGRMAIESTVGQGTTVRIIFPTPVAEAERRAS